MGAAGVQGGATGLGLIGGLMAADAEKAAGEYQEQQYRLNADFADLKAKEALRQGDIEASRYAAKGRQMVGRQRASLAAQGIDINVGSAIDVQEETKRIVEMDTNQIRTNAMRQAWGFKTEATNLRGQADFTASETRSRYVGSLLTTGARAAGGAADTYSKFRNER